MGLDYKNVAIPKSVAYVKSRLLLTTRCNRCGHIVLKSDAKSSGYSYQCLYCDEDLYKVETHRGQRCSTEELADLCVLAADLLELDHKVN